MYQKIIKLILIFILLGSYNYCISQCNSSSIGNSSKYLANSCGSIHMQSVISHNNFVSSSCGDILFTGPLDGATPTSSIKEEEILHDIKIYPNPFIDKLYMESKEISDYEIRLYNTLGELIKHENKTGSSIISIELQSLTSGLYFMQIIDTHTNKQIFKQVTKIGL